MNLAQYVPDIPHGDAITVRDLLGLRGGVYDFTTDPGLLTPYQADPALPGWSPDDALQIIRAHPDKAMAPRTGTVYSNSEYVLFGYVIERASGQPAPDYIAGLVGRMALPTTSFPTDTALPTPFSRGYSPRATPLPRRSTSRSHRQQSAGAVDGRGAGVHRPGHDPLRTDDGRRGRATPRDRRAAPDLDSHERRGHPPAVRAGRAEGRRLGRPRRHHARLQQHGVSTGPPRGRRWS